jgi:hypothetical protein
MNKRCDVGNLSEAKVLSAFMQAGYIVSKPFGDGHCYDMIVDDGERLLKVQAKTGRLIKGVIHFYPRSNSGRWYNVGEWRTYEGKVDLIAIYCPETDRVYVISPDGLRAGSYYLRVDQPHNNQSKGIRWAVDYELKPLRPEMP